MSRSKSIEKAGLALLFILAGCATTPSSQISGYKEIGPREFIALAGHHAPPGTAICIYYAGSDGDYDYLYSQRAVMFASLDFHYYKMKRGVLVLAQRHDFDPGYQPKSSLICNVDTDEQLRERLKGMLDGQADVLE